MNTSQNFSPAEYRSILGRLFSLHRFGIKPGLERIESLCAFLGDPQKQYPVIHVAGTNGKGSTCSLIASVLREAGYRVGLYTSPHILSFNERIRVNGESIPEADIVRLASILLEESERERATFFEITTAMAFRYFAEQKTDIAVIETGLGGRLDSTNIVEPLVSVITSIDYDHTEFLGDTLEKISAEKAGIIKRNTPVVVGESRAELRKIFAEFAESNAAPVTWCGRSYAGRILSWQENFSLLLEIDTPGGQLGGLELGLTGEHQLQNAINALAALETVKERFPFTEANLREGFRNVKANSGLRGRIELVREEPPLVLDVAHNPAGIRQLVATLEKCRPGLRWNVVFGGMSDKDLGAMLSEMQPVAAKLLVAAPQVERAMKAEDLAQLALQRNFLSVEPCSSVAGAIEKALAEGEPLMIAGSFYMAGEAVEYLNAHMPAE